MSDGPQDLNREFVSSLPDDGPVVMVNLVRFRERSLDGNGSGWDAYTRYSKADMPLLKRVGGTILWAGYPLTDKAEGPMLSHRPSACSRLMMGAVVTRAGPGAPE